MSNDYILGRGQLFIELNAKGERYIGNTPGFTLSVETETLDHFSDDNTLSERDASALLSVTRSSTVTCDNIAPENIGLFIVGDAQEMTQAAKTTTQTTPVMTVSPGFFYQIGGSTPVRDISDVVLLRGETGTDRIAASDYRVDAKLGRIEILASGTIQPASKIRIQYKNAASSWQRINSQTKTQEGAVRYIAANAKGPNYDVYMPSVIIQPSGSMSFKSRNEWATMEFNLNIQSPTGGGPALIIDGRAI